jgi:glutathione S-transferase
VALNYTTSEVHANFGPLFGAITPENKALQIEKLHKKFEYLAAHSLKNTDFLVGNKFSIADSYLYIVLGWDRWVGVDLAAFPTLQTYWNRVDQLSVVKEAHAKMATNPSST